MKLFILCQLFWPLAALLAAPPPRLSAQASPGTNREAATLEALVADVLEHNLELHFYRLEIAAARGERRSAAQWANPELATTLGQKSVRSGNLSDEGTAWSVSLQQSFEWPGRLSLRKAIANHQMQLAQLGFDQFKTALAARTRSLGYGIFAAQEKADASQEVAARFQHLRETLVQRDPAGLTPLLETRIIEATELILKRRFREARQTAQAERLELNQLRGQPWGYEWKMQFPQLRFIAPPETAFLLESARTNNFELRMRQVELEQQGFKVSLAKRDGFPAVTVGPYFSQERAFDREQQIGVALSLPLPLWNRNKGNIETAAARQLQAETSLHVTQRQVERRIVERALAYQSKLDEMADWRSDAATEFRKAAELADRHYRLGAVPVTTYVELQKQYLEALEALLETRREAIEASQELQRLTGLEFITTEASKSNPEETR